MSNGTLTIAAVNTHQQAVGHIVHKLAAHTTARAGTHALVLNLVIGTVFNIAEPKSTGIESILLRCGRQADNCTIQLAEE